jgi:hypothetical protein
VGLQILCGRRQRFVLPELGYCDMGSPPRPAYRLMILLASGWKRSRRRSKALLAAFLSCWGLCRRQLFRPSTCLHVGVGSVAFIADSYGAGSFGWICAMCERTSACCTFSRRSLLVLTVTNSDDKERAFVVYSQ